MFFKGLSILSFCNRLADTGGAEGDHRNAEYKARYHIEHKHSAIAVLKKRNHIVGERRECRQATAETCNPEEVFGLGQATGLIEVAVEHTYDYTSDHVGHERP